MIFSEKFQQNKENPLRDLQKKQTLNQRYNQLEPLKLSYNELDLIPKNKSSEIIQYTDCSQNIISNLLKEKPNFNKIYSKIDLSREKKRNNFKLSANEIINNFLNQERFHKKRNCPAKEVKINLLETEIDKNDSLKNSINYKDPKINPLKMKYDLISNRKNNFLRKEKSTKINPKISNLLEYYPGEWKKARNCSLKYHYNKNKKSIDEVTELLQHIDGRVKVTFDIFKKTAEKDFDDIISS